MRKLHTLLLTFAALALIAAASAPTIQPAKAPATAAPSSSAPALGRVSKREEADLVAQQAMAVFAGAQVVLTLLGVLLLKGTLDATRAAVADTSQATAAMQEANRIAQDSQRPQLLPFIGAAHHSFCEWSGADGSSGIMSSVRVEFGVENFGRSHGVIRQYTATAVHMEGGKETHRDSPCSFHCAGTYVRIEEQNSRVGEFLVDTRLPSQITMEHVRKNGPHIAVGRHRLEVEIVYASPEGVLYRSFGYFRFGFGERAGETRPLEFVPAELADWSDGRLMA